MPLRIKDPKQDFRNLWTRIFISLESQQKRRKNVVLKIIMTETFSNLAEDINL